jgi:hypothetical protein
VNIVVNAFQLVAACAARQSREAGVWFRQALVSHCIQQMIGCVHPSLAYDIGLAYGRRHVSWGNTDYVHHGDDEPLIAPLAGCGRMVGQLRESSDAASL